MKITSRRLLASAFVLACMAVFCLLPLDTAMAAGVCPETTGTTADGPQPQDITAVLATDKKSVTATTHFAPCPQQYAGVEFSFSLFDSNGAFLSIGSQDTPSTPQTAPAPQVVIPVQATIVIAPATADRLLKKLQVQVMWQACPTTGGTDCAEMAWHFRSYLIDVPSFTPAAHR